MQLLKLKEYCEAEFENIDAVVSELYSVIQPEKADYSIAEMAAVATFIHNCYNGFENILKRVIVSKQITARDTPTWHKDLLKTALDEGIIPDGLYETLSNYLSFRHFFVHAYSFNIRWDELRPLVDNLPITLKEFKAAIYTYLEK